METTKLEVMMRQMVEDAKHEAEDPIVFPPLLHRIRLAEVQVKRAEALSVLAGKSEHLTSQDKADVLDSLQSARGLKSDAQRDLQDFLKAVGQERARYYLSIAQKLQSSRRRSIELRRWQREGLIIQTDPCYQNLEDRSIQFAKKATRAASLLAVMELEVSSKLGTVPEEPVEARPVETPPADVPENQQGGREGGNDEEEDEK